ncbi:RNase A-like domain-containing protein [Streptomyces sp. NPDC046942]|uniref:RNase A-like domain-containing protein n=1 Tax=Streptomyces sp. NPDC046942 TaxID=3155137 RepID=UPI0033E0E41A
MGSLPSDSERQKEREQLKTAAPGASGGFELKPQHLYYTSAVVRDGQFDYDKGATTLVNALNQYSQSAGTGAGPDAFATAYMQIAEKFLQVWAASVVSVGGVAVGLTLTANNYQAADWASRGMYGPPPRHTPPVVIDKAPDYGKINDIKWSGTGQDAGSWAISGVLGEIPDFLANIIRPAVEYGLNLGKTHEITPGAREDDLNGMATAWREAGNTALKAGDNFTSAISYITAPHGNNEWQSAMNGFCQSIWGTTAWGRSRNAQGQVDTQGGRSWKTAGDVAPAQRRPILEVLHHTADTLQKTCDELVQVARTCRETTTNLAKHAAEEMAKDLTTRLDPLELLKLAATDMFGELVMAFRRHMDRAAADRAVEIYQQKFSEAASTLLALEWELDEALRSAPTFVAEDARAEAFGMRALNSFKNEYKWTNPDDTKNGVYKIDLASMEWLDGGHTLDKHVGKTDEQLAQRLRDQGNPPTQSWPYGKPSIGAASTFETVESAQELTQYNIDRNSAEITAWLKGPPPPTNNSRPESFDGTAPNGEYSGRSVSKQPTDPNDPQSGYKDGGMQAKAVRVKGIRTVLKYDDHLNPPFVVLTSMPIP